MHDKCKPIENPIEQGDIWLSQNVPGILNSAAYKKGGALFITLHGTKQPPETDQSA